MCSRWIVREGQEAREDQQGIHKSKLGMQTVQGFESERRYTSNGILGLDEHPMVGRLIARATF